MSYRDSCLLDNNTHNLPRKKYIYVVIFSFKDNYPSCPVKAFKNKEDAIKYSNEKAEKNQFKMDTCMNITSYRHTYKDHPVDKIIVSKKIKLK